RGRVNGRGMGWSKTDILAATGGKVLDEGKTTRYGEVVTDSTQVKKGSVFVALKGERLDGHRCIPDALRRGASCVILHRPIPGKYLGKSTIIRGGDTLKALGDLA